jgi:acyl carrier protein
MGAPGVSVLSAVYPSRAGPPSIIPTPCDSSFKSSRSPHLSSTQPPISALGDAPEQTALETELAVLLVESLNLEIAPSEIVPSAPLYGEGLGLDSIDILEVALEVSRKYGFQLRSDDERNQQIFQSLRSLAAHVAQNRGDS